MFTMRGELKEEMKSNQVSLRPIKYEDLGILNKWKNDEEIFKYLGGGYNPQSIDDQKKYMDQLIEQNNNSKRFIIVFDDISVGMIGLYGINFVNRNSEIGIYIGDKDYHGLGIGNASLKLLENFSSNYLNLMKLKISVVEDNSNAVKFWEKNNYSIIGRRSKERYIDGSYCDLLLMEKFIK